MLYLLLFHLSFFSLLVLLFLHFIKQIFIEYSDAGLTLVNKTDVVSLFVKITISCHLFFFFLLHPHCHQQHPQILQNASLSLVLSQVLIKDHVSTISFLGIGRAWGLLSCVWEASLFMFPPNDPGKVWPFQERIEQHTGEGTDSSTEIGKHVVMLFCDGVKSTHCSLEEKQKPEKNPIKLDPISNPRPMPNILAKLRFFFLLAIFVLNYVFF